MPLTAVDYDTQDYRPQTSHDSFTSTRFALALKGSPARAGVEQYISQQYQRIHNARLNHFLPLLLSVSQNNSTLGAIGLSPGHHRPMFLEQYLDDPIEQKMAAYTHQPFDRNSLVEIGNLAVSHQGYSTLLFIVMAMSLHEAGYQWMAFTITSQVEKIIARLGFRPTFLIDADPGRLGEGQCNWGSYYQNQPKVMFGNLHQIAEIVDAKNRLRDVVGQYRTEIAEIAQQLVELKRLVSE